VLKNLRSTTAMKMLSATTPTKMAASHSIELIIRSITLRFMLLFSKKCRPGRRLDGCAGLQP
jgi:hypothetical protein